MENVEYFNSYLRSLKDDARCTRDGKSRQKLHSTKDDACHQQTGLKFKEETNKILHLERNFVKC